MTFALWLTLGGSLLLCMALSGSVMSRMPISTSMIYLGAGIAIGPLGFALAAPVLVDHTQALEHGTEIIVLLSLFTAGLKMSVALRDRRWYPPLRLALLSMVLTVAMVTAIGVGLLGLPLGVAVLLGGILAPTDPVLATEVQVADVADRDRLRFALTGEGGLNDGTAFPVVMLGLGLVGAHEIGGFGWRWLAVDLVWASVAGLAVGAAMGAGLGRLLLLLRRRDESARGYENFLSLGLIGLAYGAAVAVQGYGFLAVFAAGLALRHTEQKAPEDETTKAEMVVNEQLGFNEQLDRIGEMVGVVVLGLLLASVMWVPAAWWFVPLMLLGVRPLSVAMGLAGSSTLPLQRRLIGWFGIRGIGSLYYLCFAINHGLPPQYTSLLVGLTVAVVVSSIVVHGTSMTPLMAFYRRRLSGRKSRSAENAGRGGRRGGRDG